MNQEIRNRISALTRISRVRELTPEEQQERAVLRAEYMAAMRKSLRTQLDQIVVEEEDGSRHSLKRTQP